MKSTLFKMLRMPLIALATFAALGLSAPLDAKDHHKHHHFNHWLKHTSYHHHHEVKVRFCGHHHHHHVHYWEGRYHKTYKCLGHE